MPHAQRNPNPHFPHLFEPLTVGARTLRNRIVMGSMHTRLDAEPDATARKAAFYGERAAGGVAMVITGGIAPNAAGRMEEDAAVLDSEREFDDHRATVRAIQTGGALAIMQILHAGRYAKIERPVGPSAIASPINKRTIHALTDAEVEQAYRRLIGQYHPDRLVGVAEDLRRQAEDKAGEINAAYERIRKQRRMR